MKKKTWNYLIFGRGEKSKALSIVVGKYLKIWSVGCDKKKKRKRKEIFCQKQEEKSWILAIFQKISIIGHRRYCKQVVIKWSENLSLDCMKIIVNSIIQLYKNIAKFVNCLMKKKSWKLLSIIGKNNKIFKSQTRKSSIISICHWIKLQNSLNSQNLFFLLQGES